MNEFNERAAEAGREFARANPKASSADIDWAAPALNPARRHFQDAAHEALRPKLFSWSIGVSDHATSGFATSYEGAADKIKELAKLYREEKVEIRSYSIDDPDGVRLLSMDTHP